MRIALFTDTFVPKIDGIVTTLCETVRQLRAGGHEVLVVAPDGGASTFEGARVIGSRGWAFPMYPDLKLALPRASLRAEVEAFQPDLIHVADPVMLGVAGLYFGGGKNGGALRLPLVVSYHTDLPAYLHYFKLGFLERCIWPILRARHNRATLNLCTSQTIVDDLRQHGIQRLGLWPGGVDTARFHPDRRCPDMRARLTGGHPEDPLLLCVGRLSPEKGLERLKNILQAFPNARLALVGDGPHHKALEQHFSGMPVVMPGFLRGQELAAAYASSDVFLMPSRTETLGLVVLEAMSSGLPVVAARAGGIPELIEDGVSGCLFETEEEAIQATRAFLDSPDRRAMFGRAARLHAARQSWNKATGTLLEHYRAACAMQPISERESAAARPGFGLQARKMASKSTLYAIRKLLP